MTLPRLLLYLPDLDGGGAQRTLINLANALHRAGAFQVLLVLGQQDGPARSWLNTDVPVEVLPPGRARGQILSLRRAIRRFDPQAVMSTLLHGNLTLWLATRWLPSPPKLILRETNSHRHRGDLSVVLRFLAGRAYRRADRFVALSEGVRREMVDLYHLDPARTVTIHNPVDIERFRTDSTPASPDGHFRLITLGRLAAQKNHPCLLRALAQLQDSDIHLTILGEGPARQSTEALIAELALADRVTLAGHVSDPVPYLAQSDLFVLSSRYEGFGHVLVEAMAAGLAVISTDCPYGPADIIADGETGVLVANDDPAALAAAIARLKADAPLRQKLAEAGRRRADDFAAEKIAAQYSTLILSCIGDR